jgi:hypothetical protein
MAARFLLINLAACGVGEAEDLASLEQPMAAPGTCGGCQPYRRRRARTSPLRCLSVPAE